MRVCMRVCVRVTQVADSFAEGKDLGLMLVGAPGQDFALKNTAIY